MTGPDNFEATSPHSAADAAHQALVATALRQAANAPADGRGAAGRVTQRVRELGDTVTATSARMAGELNTPGTPAELLAEAHLRAVVHHTAEYLHASAVAAVESGQDPDQAASRARRMLLHFARSMQPPGVAR